MFRGEGGFPDPGASAVTVGRELRCTLANRPSPLVAGCAPHQNLVTGASGTKSVAMRKVRLLEAQQI